MKVVSTTVLRDQHFIKVGVLTSKTPTIRLTIETSNASLIEVSWKYLSLKLSLSSIRIIDS